VPAGGAVLDLGCGCGVPLARDLAAGGYQVTGVDLSVVQVEGARRLVRAARFLLTLASGLLESRDERLQGRRRDGPPLADDQCHLINTTNCSPAEAARQIAELL
jgi:SAM-dependent methyltransferase